MRTIRIKSDGTTGGTHAVFVLENEKEEELPPFTRVEWVADTDDPLCTATVTFLKAEVEVAGEGRMSMPIAAEKKLAAANALCFSRICDDCLHRHANGIALTPGHDRCQIALEIREALNEES